MLNFTKGIITITDFMIFLSYDQLTYSNFKEHMLNFTKGIITVTYFMITYLLDHLRGHTISIS